MCQLKTKVITLENEKRETSEILAEVQKRNFHLEAQLTHDKSNHEKVLKKTKKKIKQLHQQFMKSHIQEELVLKELEMMKEVVEMKKKEGLKHHQEIITKANAKSTLGTRKSNH
jgi:hypothetical protein